jgi:hypothetical protein
LKTWSNNIERLKRYQEQNAFNFIFLKSEENVNNDYEVKSVPTFFIVDENRVIRKVINGYGKGSTDKMILESINELL